MNEWTEWRVRAPEKQCQSDYINLIYDSPNGHCEIHFHRQPSNGRLTADWKNIKFVWMNVIGTITFGPNSNLRILIVWSLCLRLIQLTPIMHWITHYCHRLAVAAVRLLLCVLSAKYRCQCIPHISVRSVRGVRVRQILSLTQRQLTNVPYNQLQ